jgi:two-component system OmpR family sensor kinase
VSVADDGPGLTSEAAGRVFERFYRADAARNRRDGGSGLGLAIVAALVAGHGGAVSVESAPGAGACFRVELPLADPAAEPSQASSDLPGTSRQVGSNAAALRGTTEG